MTSPTPKPRAGKHTPGPWKVVAGALIQRANGQVIARAENDTWHTDEEVEANARRIVACVNACEGIETGALEAGNFCDSNIWKECTALRKYAPGPCSCVAGLPDSECPQHGMYSKQAEVFYHEVMIERIKKADQELTAALHKECIATGLISAAQWNTGIAPWLARLTSAIEPYRETLEQPPQAIEAARLNASAEADNGNRPERSESSLRQAQGTNPAEAAAYEHLFRQFCALRDRETGVRTANNALRAALQHGLDSEQEGYTDENEPSWITEARAVLVKYGR